MKKIFVMCCISLAMFANQAFCFEINGRNTAEIKFEEDLYEFVESLNPTELIGVINSLKPSKEDCSTQLFTALRSQLTNFSIEKKIGKTSQLLKKINQQRNKCSAAGLRNVLKLRASRGAFLH